MTRIKKIILSLILFVFVMPVLALEIHKAASKGDMEKVKELLNKDPELVNSKDDNGSRPIHYASLRGHKNIAELLITRGADVNARDQYLSSPLHLAARGGHQEVVDLLIRNGGYTEHKNNLGMTPLYFACLEGRNNIAALLIAKGADINTKRSDGETLLHIASAIGNKEIVELLIKKGLTVNIRRRYGITPLHLASTFGQKLVVEILIANGADLNVKSDDGRTPLDLAIAAGNDEVSEFLKSKGASERPINYLILKGEYFGQKKPGLTPEVFAPGILLNTHRPHGPLTFSPDGNEIYWVGTLTFGSNSKLWYMRQENGLWKPPEVVPFSSKYIDDTFAFSRDGKKLFFISTRPIEKNGERKDFDIWFVERTEAGWGEPQNLGAPVNTEKHDIGSSISNNGTIYLSCSNLEGGMGSSDIYQSRFLNGRYEEPVNLGDAINSKFSERQPAIAPDESFLILVSGRPDGYGDADLYVSFRNKDGTWTKAKNMGKNINSSAMDLLPKVSIDGKYLFFMSRRNGIGEFFWVDTKILDSLKPKELK